MPYSLARVRPTSSKKGRRRATSTRFNPLAASWRANSFPMPEDAPVIRAQGPNVFFSMRFIVYSFDVCPDFSRDGSLLRHQSVTGIPSVPAPGHRKLNFDDGLVYFGGLERLDEDFPTRPCQVKMVVINPGSQLVIGSYVLSDADGNHRCHGFDSRQGADGHRPTIGQQKRLKKVAVKQETHLHIDVLGLKAVRVKHEGKLAEGTSPSLSWQGAVQFGHQRKALLF